MASATNSRIFLTCLNCRKESVDCKTCQSCEVATYCGKECQKAAFRQHKRTCFMLRNVSSGDASVIKPSSRGSGEAKIFSWDFLSSLRNSVPEKEIDYFYAYNLLEMGCEERNKIAFLKFLDYFWDRLMDGGFRFVPTLEYYQRRAVLMLLVLRRVDEADNLARFMQLKPDDDKMKMSSREALRKSYIESARQFRQTGVFNVITETVLNWFLYACVLISRLVAARKEAVASKEVKQLEPVIEEILQLIHEFNEFLLPGVVDPSTLTNTPGMSDQALMMMLEKPEIIPNTPEMRMEFAKDTLNGHTFVLLEMAGGLDKEFKKVFAEFGVL